MARLLNASNFVIPLLGYFYNFSKGQFIFLTFLLRYVDILSFIPLRFNHLAGTSIHLPSFLNTRTSSSISMIKFNFQGLPEIKLYVTVHNHIFKHSLIFNRGHLHAAALQPMRACIAQPPIVAVNHVGQSAIRAVRSLFPKNREFED